MDNKQYISFLKLPCFCCGAVGETTGLASNGHPSSELTPGPCLSQGTSSVGRPPRTPGGSVGNMFDKEKIRTQGDGPPQRNTLPRPPVTTHGCGHELALEPGTRVGAACRVGGLSRSPREQNKASPGEQKWGQQQSARRGGPALRGVAGAALLSVRATPEATDGRSVAESKPDWASCSPWRSQGRSLERAVAAKSPSHLPAQPLIFRDIHC